MAYYVWYRVTHWGERPSKSGLTLSCYIPALSKYTSICPPIYAFSSMVLCKLGIFGCIFCIYYIQVAGITRQGCIRGYGMILIYINTTWRDS